MEWISVKDILPDFGFAKDVLTFGTHDSARIGYYSQKNKIWVIDNCGYSLEDVTHWMPLPESPKI